MSEEYLWDRSGEPDPEIARLENLLAPYRHQESQRRWRPGRMALLAVAAALALAVSLAYMLRGSPASVWQMAGRNLAVGQTVETGANSGATLEASEVGQVELDRNSSLRVLEVSRGVHRLSLKRGTMHALIWAPPSRFTVDTPSAKSIDLGCAYTLTVLSDNSGLLTVQTGWVAFQAGKLESFIPAGAACHTRPGRGPGLPYFESSSQDFQTAVARFDKSLRHEDLETIIKNARKEDALTLWHLIVRSSGGDRVQAVQRFAKLVPAADVKGLLAGDSAAIDQAWDLLDLGRTDWWRMWKHGWEL